MRHYLLVMPKTLIKVQKRPLIKKIESCNDLLVSHDMKTIQELCDSAIVVDNGNIKYFDTVKEAIREYQIINS